MYNSHQLLADQESKEFKFFFPVYQDVVARFDTIAEVSSSYIDIWDAFSITFAQMFVTEAPDYDMGSSQRGASRSNWTYHTALSLAQTAKMFGLICKFETQGKRDAIIEMPDPPQVMLVAEWEWDYRDIFGKGKELEKLRESCKQFPQAQAFLLTYCPQDEYVEYLEQVAKYWMEPSKSRKKNAPWLYFHAVIFNEEGTFRVFDRLRSVAIGTKAIQVWNDQPF